jgi:hypothetical protein
MNTSSTVLRDRSADRLCLIILLACLGALLCFSSFFYLTTEDYEAVVASRLIREGTAIGRSTGWPYTPLTPYLFYPYAVLFGENILAFRLLTASLTLASIFPIYRVLRSLCTPFLSFALTWFSFSLTTFPHPRLEYYVEAAFLSFAIYFAVKVIRENKRRDVYLCATFLFAAFASRGFPNVAILVGAMPLALVFVLRLIRPEHTPFRRRFASPDGQRWRWWGGLLLFAYCTGFLIAFMKKAVHNRLFYEYASLVGAESFAAMKEIRSLVWLACPVLLLMVYGALSWKKFCPLHAESEVDQFPQANRNWSVYQLVLPFAVCGLVFLIIGLAAYATNDLFFFLFPLDIFLDHTRQLGSGRSYVIPLFISFVVLMIFLHAFEETSLHKTRIALFLILLLPSTFARFFPTYNLLYLVSFTVAVFVGVILPRFMQDYLKNQGFIALRIQWTLALCFLLFATGSNLTLLVATQLSDLYSGRVVRMNRGPVKGIFVEKDVVNFFHAIHTGIEGIARQDEKFAFLSNRYLSYVPLIYGYEDVFAGQNLVIGLGKLWSFDDVLKRTGALSKSRFDSNGMIYNWRKAGLEKIERSKARVVVMSFYGSEALTRKLEPSSDPFKEYLRQHFIVGKVIEPAMKIHRRSHFSEGAVIFIRKEKF